MIGADFCAIFLLVKPMNTLFVSNRIEISVDKERCASCSSCCCKNLTGVLLAVEDFGDNVVEKVIEMYENGLITLKSSMSIPNEAPRIKPNFQGTCVFFMPFGCMFPADQRPFVCRFFGPSTGKGYGYSNFRCDNYYGYPEGYKIGDEWKPYYREIKRRLQL